MSSNMQRCQDDESEDEKKERSLSPLTPETTAIIAEVQEEVSRLLRDICMCAWNSTTAWHRSTEALQEKAKKALAAQEPEPVEEKPKEKQKEKAEKAEKGTKAADSRRKRGKSMKK